MSARREARAATPVLQRPEGQSGVPAALAIGCCVDVWLELGAESPQWSAKRRFELARHHWVESVGATDAEARQLVPHRAPWTIEYLSYRGQAERVGKPVAAIVREYFARAGCDVGDIPELRREADELFADALGGSLGRAYRRRKRSGVGRRSR